MTTLPKAIVIDTCFLRATSHKHPEAEKLWKMSRSGTIAVFIPHIALEEWRTQKVDDLLNAITSAQNSIDKMWRNNIVAEALDNPNDYLFYPAKEVIDGKSKERMERFLEQNKIRKIDVSEAHAINTWARYFDCKPPFSINNPRESRRKDIPDAWILEAAIALKTSFEVHCLLSETGDQKLKSAFETEGFLAHNGLKELFDHLELPGSDVEESPVTAAVTPPLNTNVNETLKNIDDAERDLQIRILGYVYWLAPIAKSYLAELLQRKGHAPQLANNAVERFALRGLITDTGHNYLPDNKGVCKEAAVSIMPEILELLNGQ